MITAVIGIDKISKQPVLIGLYETEAEPIITEQKVSSLVSKEVNLANYESVRYVRTDIIKKVS
jgi:hypothetical protein